jgi:uncharacterized protein YigA (DUF484 family)
MQVQDIANYLTSHPDFFDQHPELLAALQITAPTERPGDLADRTAIADAARTHQGT